LSWKTKHHTALGTPYFGCGYAALCFKGVFLIYDNSSLPDSVLTYVMEALPKVELHLHLDCSLSYEVVARLQPEITEEQYRQTFIAPRKCSDLAEYLTRAPHAVRLMQSKESLQLVVEDVFEQLVADNLIYAELRYAPLLHLEDGLEPEEVVATIDRATEKCIRDTGIEARLILCTLRHYTREQSLQTVRLVEQFRGSRTVALDIAGDEAAFPLAPHRAAYDYAHERGLHVTAHAGEAAGAESVWETLRELRPTRIGHGVRSAEDPQLVDHLREKGIHLEVCPTSNVQTNICRSIHEHPVDHLYRQGVPLNINTDCRTISDTNLRKEYRQLSQTFGWSKDDLLKCNLAGLRAAFLPEETKARLESRLVEAYSAQPV
jgi:adenosine deaminase